VQFEVPVGGLQRPADIMIYNLEAAPVALDVFVVHPTIPLLTPSLNMSKTVLHKEQSKLRMYSDLCDHAGVIFCPFVVSTYGDFGPAAITLMKQFASALSSSCLSHYDSFLQHITQRISVAVMKIVGFQLLCGVCNASPSLLLDEDEGEGGANL